MWKDRVFIYMLLLSAGILIIGCDDDSEPVMTVYETKLADSLYKKQIPYIRKEMDSLCTADHEKYKSYFIDSLKQDYINGIGELQDYLKRGDD